MIIFNKNNFNCNLKKKKKIKIIINKFLKFTFDLSSILQYPGLRSIFSPSQENALSKGQVWQT